MYDSDPGWSFKETDAYIVLTRENHEVYLSLHALENEIPVRNRVYKCYRALNGDVITLTYENKILIDICVSYRGVIYQSWKINPATNLAMFEAKVFSNN